MRITPNPQHSSHLALGGSIPALGQTGPKSVLFTGQGDSVSFEGRSATAQSPQAETGSPQISNWLLGRGRKNNGQPLETILVLQPDHQATPPTVRVLPSSPNPLPQNPTHRRRATSNHSGMLPMVIITVLGASLTVLNIAALWARDSDENKNYSEKKLIASLGL